MTKTYVLDTNVLLHNPDALFEFGDNEVVLPFTVIEEIDDQKKRQDEIGRNARQVNRYLDDLRQLGSLSEGAKTAKGGIVRVEMNNVQTSTTPECLSLGKADNRILAVALNLGKSEEVILVSKDLNVRIKADVLGVKAEDYRKDRVDHGELYTGVSEIELSEEEVHMFYDNKVVALPDGIIAYPNQFFITEICGAQIILCYKNGLLVPLKYQNKSNWGLTPLNTEQLMAQELLMDNEIPVVSIVGPAGTGKTLLSLAFGMEAVTEKGLYSKLVVTRPIVPMGNDIGYLPGSKDEKIDPWMKPIYDNLCYLMRNLDGDPMDEVADFKTRGKLEVEVMTYIRGRSIPEQLIICDEAQNLTPPMIKTLVTRVGEGTKIIFTGDPSQIDTPFLDASSNGLSYLVERLKREEISGHITLVKSVRSKVAEVCARAL